MAAQSGGEREEAHELLDAEPAQHNTARVLFMAELFGDHRRRPWRRASAGLVAAACAVIAIAAWGRWSQASRGQVPARGRGAETLTQTLMEVTAKIAWVKHPGWCLSIMGREKEYGKQLQVSKCLETYDKFIIGLDPAGGLIRSQVFPDYCLDAPGGPQLQLWKCNESRPENTHYLVNANHDGRIQLQRDPSMCLDVPLEKEAQGNALQMWNCSDPDEQRNVDHFMIIANINCRFGPWSPWSACPKTCKALNHRKRTRVPFQVATQGGLSCQAEGRHDYEWSPCPGCQR